MNPLLALKAATSNLPAISASTNALTARVTGLNRFGLVGFGALEIFPAENPKLLELGYMQNHYVFTIADWKALQFAMARPVVYEVKDSKSLRKYKSLNPVQKKDSYSLRTKSIEEVDDLNDPLVKLLKNPNPFQTWAEYAYAQSVLWDFGNDLNYGVRLQGGVNKGQIREMYHLSLAAYSGQTPGVGGYASYVDSTGANAPVDGRDVLHLRRFNPDPLMQSSGLWGMSKLAPARRLLTKSTNAIEAEAEMMQNRGGRTIIFPKGMQWDEDVSRESLNATAEVRKKLKQAGSGGIAGVGVEIGAIELSMSPVDLDILKSNQGTKEEWCALWHTHVLSVFSSTSGATFSNIEEANKASLRGGVLPDVYLRDEKYNDWLVPAYGDNRYIESDTDVYPELQANKIEKAQWMANVPLTGDEIRQAFGYETLGTPEMQIPLVASNRMPVTDFGANNDPNQQDPNNDGTY